MDIALDRRLDQRSCAEKALLPTPRRSTNKVHQDVGGAVEGLHLREQLCPKQTTDIRH
jgi:hypothetical protein